MSTAPSTESVAFQPPSWEAIVAAHARIASRIHRTPVLTSTSLNAISRAQLFFKCENLQKTGSFKIRGASNAILSLTEKEVAKGIVTQSSGNHGAAVACAAAWRGVPAWIVMPKNAPAVKVKAIEGYGGNVIFCEPTVTARKATCDRIQLETGAHLVHPYDDDRIIAGQATAAKSFWKKSATWTLCSPPLAAEGCLAGRASVPRAFARTCTFLGASRSARTTLTAR